MTILDRFSVDGRVAVVTGASSGLGVAFAEGLAQADADVVLAARRADRLEETRSVVEKAGRRALCVVTDVAQQADCQHVVDAAMTEFGRVDILISNAGIGTAVPAMRETVEEFKHVIDVNLNGCYRMAQASAAVMRPGKQHRVLIGRHGPRSSSPPRSSFSPARQPASSRDRPSPLTAG